MRPNPSFELTRLPTSIALVVLSLAYWLSVFALSASRVTAVAWVCLYAACLLGAIFSWVRLPSSAGVRFWLSSAGYSLLLAALFFGANGALDALHGAHRAKAQVAESLGGLELWFVLCPGVLVVCVAGCVRSLLIAAEATASEEVLSTPAAVAPAVSAVTSNPSIERTSQRPFRAPYPAAHFER